MNTADFKIQRSSLQTEVVTRLRNEIVEGVWKPGARLQERVLCERYGISRSPLREAFQMLVSEGLIEISPNRGAVVSAPTPALTLQQFVLLQALELLAVELACEHASPAALQQIRRANDQMNRAARKGAAADFIHHNREVHRLIVEASGNQPLTDAYGVVARQLTRVQNLDGHLEHPMAESEGEHDEIIDALEQRDRGRAVDALSRHLRSVQDNLMKRVEPFS